MTKEQKLEILKQYTFGKISKQDMWTMFFKLDCKLVLWEELPHGGFKSNTGLMKGKEEVYQIRVPGQCNVLIHNYQADGMPIKKIHWTASDL